MRAPTPSAAAEISVPDMKDIILALDDVALRIEKSVKNVISAKRRDLDLIMRSPVLSDISELFADRKDKINDYSRRIQAEITSAISERRADLAVLTGKADALSPLSVLARGYGIVEKDGKNIRSTESLNVGDEVDISLSKGGMSAKITEIYEVKK